MTTPAAAPAASSLRGAIIAIRKELAGLVKLALLLGFVAALFFFVLVYGRMEIFSLVLPARSETTLLALATVLALGIALYVCIQHLREWALVTIGNRISRRLALPAMMAAAEARGQPKEAAGQALQDLEESSRWVSGPAVSVALDAVVVPLFILLLAILHWSLAVFTLCCAALSALISIWSHRSLAEPLEKVNDAQRAALQGVADATANGEAVAAMGMQRALLHRWFGRLQEGGAQLEQVRRILRWTEFGTELLNYVARAMVLVLVVGLSFSGIELGAHMVGAFLMVSAAMAPFARIGGMMESMAAGQAAWRRLQQLAEQPPAQPGQGLVYTCPEGLLAVEQLTVMVPGVARPVLRDISLVVSPGEVVGIAGPVGCGKSTLLRAIMGIQRPTAGGCYLDGHATWQWDRTDLARYMGYLPQEPGLEDGTVAEAIARLDEPDMVLVIEAAQRAGAHRFIVDLPDGYSTRLTAEGLSAGQRQRLGLARAIYGRPRLVVLDEPGAWLDKQGEDDLRRLVASLRADRSSVIFTSHQHALMNMADQVVTIQTGLQSGTGTRQQRLLPERRPRVQA